MSDFHEDEKNFRARAVASRGIDSEFAYYSFHRDDRRIRGEKRLLVAMLERALADALYSVGRLPAKSSMRDSILASKKWARDALRWIMQPTDPLNPVCSFEWVCLNLDLDHISIKNRVINARHQQARFRRLGGRGGQNNKLRLCKTIQSSFTIDDDEENLRKGRRTV